MSNIVLPGTNEIVSTETNDSGEKVQVVRTEPSFLERICLKALAKLTFSMFGLRCDISGQNINTVTTVTTVAACNAVAIGRASADGQGIQLSQLAFEQGFRRNLVVS